MTHWIERALVWWVNWTHRPENINDWTVPGIAQRPDREDDGNT